MTTTPAAPSGELNLDHLEALARAATPGPWGLVEVVDRSINHLCPVNRDNLSLLTVVHEGETPYGAVYLNEDAKFIAAANPAAVLELIALARQAQSSQPSEAAQLDALDDNDREKLVSAIKQLSELATGNIEGMGKDHLFKPGQLKKATMADVKRILPFVIGGLRSVVGTLDAAPSLPAPAQDAGDEQDDDATAKMAEKLGAHVKWANDPDMHHLIEFTPPVLRAALANQPAPLDADEMTRLRRLMKALGHAGAFEQPDEYVRGILCTLLGQAAGELERTNQPAPQGTSIALAEVTDKLGRMSAENVSLGMENRQLREQLAAANQPAPTVPAARDALRDLWIREDMARDAVAAVATMPRKDLQAAHKSAVEDLLHWRRRALAAEASGAHQPAQEKVEPPNVFLDSPETIAAWCAQQEPLAAAPVAVQNEAGDEQAWQKLTDDTEINGTRRIDVVLENGCYEYRRWYNEIDWTQVQDWRYAASPVVRAQSEESRQPMPDWLAYDVEADVLTIYGIRYAGCVLRAFSNFMPLGQPFVLDSRSDGVLTLTRLQPDAGAQQAHAGADEELTAAARDVLGERQRQVEVEGWTPAHDDAYHENELPRAASAYTLGGQYIAPPASWPWTGAWWKPRDARSNYVRAGALLIAEIERLDRAAIRAAQEGGAHENR